MDHLIRKVIFDAEYFQPGVAVYLETEETKQQGLIYTSVSYTHLTLPTILLV